MGNGTILVVEDEFRIRRMLKDFLLSCNYEIIEAEDGEKALAMFYASNSKIDLILMDVMMPKKDGFEVLAEIRDISLVPVIMLTAKSEEYDQLSGFKHGADDYVTKPFSPVVLLAHIEAVLRRCKCSANEIRNIGEIKIDPLSMVVTVGKEVVNLAPKEYDLLVFLTEHMDAVLSREQILNEVWNYDYIGGVRTVDTHIKQLRAKLGIEYIQTVHGRGYRFGVNVCSNQ
ncbi:MAG: response regulator transcription factor [Mobilitalea sp.]